MTPPNGNLLLRSDEVADLLNTTVRTVQNWANSGRLPAVRVPDGTGDWRFRRADIERYLDGDQEIVESDRFQKAPNG